MINTFNDLTTHTSEGVVEFELQGRDASSGEETYSTGRFLYSDLLENGTTVLDFNQAYNPPCAFNPYTTCPKPIDDNVLPANILAGERDYAEVKLPAGPS